MRVKPPRVPPAVQLAFAGTQGPRVLPGTYTVRMTKGGEVHEARFEIGLDRRAAYTGADRKAQYDAAMRVHRLFGDESAFMDRILAVRAGLAQRGDGAKDDATRSRIAALDAEVDAVRRRIVATKEGGAITGEERLREHTDQLYGAIMSYEGAPAAYQMERIGVLEAELADVEAKFDGLLAGELPSLNRALQSQGLPPVETPPRTAGRASESSSGTSGWLSTRKRADKKAWYFSLPQDTVVYR
jgi:hypothetical protein